MSKGRPPRRKTDFERRLTIVADTTKNRSRQWQAELRLFAYLRYLNDPELDDL